MVSNYNVKKCSICPGYTEYYCHTCQKDLCQNCKVVHVIDLETKCHEVTIYTEKQLSKFSVKQCSFCQGFTEYYCHSCDKDLCQHCKAVHVIDLDTKHHEVTIYREKFKYLSKTEDCVIHSNRKYNKYCDPCEVPVCDSCSEHKPPGYAHLFCFFQKHAIQHRLVDIKTAYEMKRQQHKDWIHNVRSGMLYNRPVLLKIVKSDVDTAIQTWQSEFNRVHSNLILKEKELNIHIFNVVDDVIRRAKNEYSCLLHVQKNKMTKHIARIQRYQQKYEQSACKPVQFLRFIKKIQLQDTPHLTHHCLFLQTQENKMDIFEIQKTNSGSRIRKLQARNELLLKLMPIQLLKISITLIVVDWCNHISCVTQDQFWVNDSNKIVLTDTATGDNLYSVDDSLYSGSGIHTVNSSCELIYINKNNYINKLSVDRKSKSTFVKKTDCLWPPRCIYCSPSSGDLLVGMSKYDNNTRTCTGMVMRYDDTGRPTQTIPENYGTTHSPFEYPVYITENNNGDVVVSDLEHGAVIVTSQKGRFRFSYKGLELESKPLNPRGICTDALSHILVCDVSTHTVQLLSQDGHFLKFLLTDKSPGIDYSPFSLSYDVNSHRLLVGSGPWDSYASRFSRKQKSPTLSVYKHIDRNLSLTGIGKSKLHHRNEPLLKLMPHQILEKSENMTIVDMCYHISFVKSDKLWVNDSNKIILTDLATGDELHSVDDSLYSETGIHTVNGERELIYINKNNHISILSEDRKKTTVFLKETNCLWPPRCIYCSPSSGDLLVGMSKFDNKKGECTGIVVRYDDTGCTKQTIPENYGTTHSPFEYPVYITENNNGDVVVSDVELRAVVVTSQNGKRRFSYKGPELESKPLNPRGICTDALSHILVCDVSTQTVQLISQDGHFLQYLLTRETPGIIYSPYSLSYDVNSHRLWVGSGQLFSFFSRIIGKQGSLTLSVYRYIDKDLSLTDDAEL